MTSNQVAFLANMEQQRANQVREAETRRANDLNAQIQSEANQIKWSQLTETQKYNALTAALEKLRLTETQRHNLAAETETERHAREQERYSFDSLTETQRHNALSEALDSRRIDTDSRRVDVAQATQMEQSKHNRATEEVDLARVQNLVDQYNLAVRRQDMEEAKVWYTAILDTIDTITKAFTGIERLKGDK